MSLSNSPWVTVTLADVQACILAEALSLAQARAAQRQQADPISVHLPKVVARVRNKVASAPEGRLSADATKIPPELAEQTALLIAYAVVLPLAGANPHLIGTDLRAAVERAEADLEAVAAGTLAVSWPDDAVSENPTAPRGGVQVVGRCEREATRETLRGM